MTENIQNLNLKIADYTVHSIPTGEFRLDGGAMFGTVPKVLWSKTNPTDDHNRIQMECRALLLKSDKKKILIDNGNGWDFKFKFGEAAGEKFEQIYGLSKTNSGSKSRILQNSKFSKDQEISSIPLIQSLNSYDLDLSDITDVILTHLHFDHAGGSTCERNGKLLPTFPNATYYVQEKNLKTALNPNRREKASYLKENFVPLIESKVLKTLDGNYELFDNISLHQSFGHTEAQQNVKISDGINTVFYCADLIPTSTHTKLAWIMGYDLDPLKIIEEKEVILKQAAAENWYLFFEHDPFCSAAQIKFNGKDYEVIQKFNLN